MYRAILAMLLLSLPSHAGAAFVDFEDLSHGTEFTLGGSFTSKGLIFDVVEVGLSPSKIIVVDQAFFDPDSTSNDAGGTGVSLNFGRLGLDFPLPPGAQHVSFLFGEYTSHSGTIIVNGETVNPANGLRELDGTTLGGVSITAETIIEGEVISGSIGELHLNGPLQSLVVGGVEFVLDNVTINVPEPATAALLLAASIALLATRRRQRA